MAGSQQGWRSVGSGGGGGGSVTSVTASAPVVSSGGATPNISMAKADSTTNGYLSASDWITFNNKLSSAFNQQIQDEGNNVPQRNVINFVGNGVSVTDTGGKTQVSITSGQGNSIYYLNLSVSEAPYSQFSSNPVSGSQQSVTANISGSATSTIASFQTPIGIPNTTNLIGGLWTFFLHFGTSSSSTDFTIYVEVYKRTNAGIETLILTTDSFTTSTLSSTPVMILTDGVLPNTTLLTTDRIVVKVVVVNNKSSSHNITFYTEGTTNYSVSYTTLGQSIPSGAVTNVTASSPLTSSGGTTPNLAIPQANGSTNGFLSSGDWTTFNNKQNTITGGASTITTSNLSPSLALQSNASGKVEVSTVTSTELGYVSGVTSSIQTQLNNKQNTITGGASTITTSNLSPSLALQSNASGKVEVSTVTSTELGYVSGVTSSIQTQLNNKQNTITGGASTITTSNLSPSLALQSNASGKVEVSTVTSTELGYVSGVTSSIQTQLNGKQNTLVNPVTGTGASGQVSFWNGTNTQSGSNNLFWDNTNSRLGIGTASPGARLDVKAVGATSNDIAFRVQKSGSTDPLFSINGINEYEFNANDAGTGYVLFNFRGGPNGQAARIDTYAGATLRSQVCLNDANQGLVSLRGAAVAGGSTANGYNYFYANATGLSISSNGTAPVANERFSVRGLNNNQYFVIRDTGVIRVQNPSTVPTTSGITDTFQFYANDIVAGNAAPHFRTENNDLIKLYSVAGWGLPTGTFTRTTFDTATVTTAQLAERVAALIQDLRDNHGLLKA